MKYIIIDAEAIQKRIEELKEQSKHNELVGDYDSEGEIISELEQIISKSTPLIPEIEKAFAEGKNSHWQMQAEDYITNLKLDI